MRKTILLVLITLQGCTHLIPLQGSYSETAATEVIKKPDSDVWQKLLDIIVEHGYPIKFMDKDSRTLISDFTYFSKRSSFETRKGTLINRDTFIAIERFSDELPSEDTKYKISGIFAIRIKKLTDSTTSVTTKLDQIYVDEPGLNGKSTGNFEKWLLEALAK